MEEKRQGLSDAVLIEIVHGIKEIILGLISRTNPQASSNRRLG